MCSIPELKPLELYIGTNEAQNAVVYPLDQLPHLLVCGMNGCGRSGFLRTQTALLAHGAPAEQLRLVLMDETGVEFVQFRELPHLLMPPVCALEKKADAVFALYMELQQRYALFAKSGVRVLEDYNQQAETPLPRIVVIIDGMDDLLAQDECADQIQQICQKGRPVGIHMIAAARQVPEEKITAGFASRMAFRMATKSAANQIGIPDAERLPIPGTALFSPINYVDPVRVQTRELTDEEIGALIAPVATGHQYDEEFVLKANRVKKNEECSDGIDPMYGQALQCVIDAGYASTSLLQRRCNLGYARAAHILDQLEQAKVIGPYEGAQPRVVLPPYAKPKAAVAKGVKITRSTPQAADLTPPRMENTPVMNFAPLPVVTAPTMDVMPSPIVTDPAMDDVPQQTVTAPLTDSAPQQAAIAPVMDVVQLPTEEPHEQPPVLEDTEPPLEFSYQVSAVSGCDGMDGHDFEYLCAGALRANGYKKVKVTQASGDYGIDILAKKNGVSYAIQCKRYNSPVGNHAVQEAYAGAAYYSSSVPVVLTNQNFTPAARKMADSLGVELWGRSELDALLRVYESPEQRRKRIILKVLKVVLKIVLYVIGVTAAVLLVASAYTVIFAMILIFAPALLCFRPKKRRRRRR